MDPTKNPIALKDDKKAQTGSEELLKMHRNLDPIQKINNRR
jgi:hypothetical protein